MVNGSAKKNHHRIHRDLQPDSTSRQHVDAKRHSKESFAGHCLTAFICLAQNE